MDRWTGSRLALAVVLAALGVALNGSPASAISLFPHLRVPHGGTFDADVELQGMYDEMSEIYVPSMSAGDVQLFDETLFTADWVLIDTNGQRFTQAQVSARAAQAPASDFTTQRIGSITPVPGGVTALVTVAAVRTIVDTEGRYGVRGATHTLTEVTRFDDSWVRAGDSWKMKSREQLGPTKTILDQPEWGM